MFYEINVSLHGKHLFATHERSLTSRYEALQVYDIFVAKFPESEGYKISCTLWQHTGREQNMEEIRRELNR